MQRLFVFFPFIAGKKSCQVNSAAMELQIPLSSTFEGCLFYLFPKNQKPRGINVEHQVYLCVYVQKMNLMPVSSTLICSKHFVGARGPTDDNSDPLPATVRPEEASHFDHFLFFQSIPYVGQICIVLSVHVQSFPPGIDS